VGNITHVDAYDWADTDGTHDVQLNLVDLADARKTGSLLADGRLAGAVFDVVVVTNTVEGENVAKEMAAGIAQATGRLLVYGTSNPEQANMVLQSARRFCAMDPQLHMWAPSDSAPRAGSQCPTCVGFYYEAERLEGQLDFCDQDELSDDPESRFDPEQLAEITGRLRTTNDEVERQRAAARQYSLKSGGCTEGVVRCVLRAFVLRACQNSPYSLKACGFAPLAAGHAMSRSDHLTWRLQCPCGMTPGTPLTYTDTHKHRYTPGWDMYTCADSESILPLFPLPEPLIQNSPPLTSAPSPPPPLPYGWTSTHVHSGTAEQ
jgi:hypothetical protein